MDEYATHADRPMMDRPQGAYKDLNEWVAALHDELTALSDALGPALKALDPEPSLAKITGDTDLERLVSRVDDAVQRVRSLRSRLVL
jgi:hypothetical protein